MKKCEKCGATNIWYTVGPMATESRCLDCNPPPPDAAEKVAEFMQKIEQKDRESPHYVENIENMGPEGRAAVPLLYRIYSEHGTGDSLGCAAKDALRTFEILNKPGTDKKKAEGEAASRMAHNLEGLDGFKMAASCQEFAESAVRRKTRIRTEFSALPQIIDLLGEVQEKAYPNADMGKIGGQLEDAFRFRCPNCGPLKSSAVLMVAVMKSLQGMSPNTATSFGGPNAANLAHGRCPGCGGTTFDIAYDPYKLKEVVPLKEQKTGTASVQEAALNNTPAKAVHDPNKDLIFATVAFLILGWGLMYKGFIDSATHFFFPGMIACVVGLGLGILFITRNF